MHRVLFFVRCWFLSILLLGCASTTTYVKPDAPWATIRKVGVFPFETKFESSVPSQWATQLFVTEVNKVGKFEVVELKEPLASLNPPDWAAQARKSEVDAYFRGTVDYVTEIFVDLKLVDAATEEVLWTFRYHRGSGPEFSLRYRTSQQQLHRIYRIVLRLLARNVR